MEEMQTLPMWVNVFIGIAAALGGWEAIKYLISLRANRRKDSAQAKQEEATAGQQDADLRQKELELLNQIVETTKSQYGELKQRYDELLVERKADREEMDELRREVAELRVSLAEQERKTAGLQRAFTESETKRLEAERYFCAFESCTKRQPPFGTYQPEHGVMSINDEAATVQVPERDEKGRFKKKADEGKAEG